MLRSRNAPESRKHFNGNEEVQKAAETAKLDLKEWLSDTINSSSSDQELNKTSSKALSKSYRFAYTVDVDNSKMTNEKSGIWEVP